MKHNTSLLIFVLLCTFSLNLFGQTAANNTTNSEISTESVLNNTGSSSSSFEDNPFPSTFTTVGDPNSSSKGLVWPIIRMILVLVIMVVAIFFIMKFFKKKGNLLKSDDDFLRRVSTLNIAPGKSVEIITLMDKGYLIGVTEGSINLISEIDDTELVDALNLNFDKKNNTKKPYKFSDVLDLFTKGSEKKNVYGDAEENLNDLARRNSTREDI